MHNCLSSNVFENLLFVNVNVCGELAVALFDTGAQKTIVSESFLKQCEGEILQESVSAGNNSGHTLRLNTAILKFIKIADKELTNIEVLVLEDDAFDMEDSEGRKFPADILLGYDVICNFKWNYFPAIKTLTISDSMPIAEKENLIYDVFPAVKITLDEQTYLAGIDTGHTETIIKSSVKVQNAIVTYTADEFVGVGSAKTVRVPIISEVRIRFENTEVTLHNVTVQEEIYGAPSEMDLLLGIDFFAADSWELDLPAGILKCIDYFPI